MDRGHVLMDDDTYRVSHSLSARATWLSEDAVKRTSVYSRVPQWMGRSYLSSSHAHRLRVEAHVEAMGKQPVYVQIVPGPNHCWQVVRVDLGKPFARGFLSPEQARRWIARAMRAGILPVSVVEVEAATDAVRDVGMADPQRSENDCADAS